MPSFTPPVSASASFPLRQASYSEADQEEDMNATRSSIIGASMLTFCLCSQAQAQYVRLAELEIDPAQLDAFKAAVTESVQAGARIRRTCHVRAGRAQRVAHASAWSDADRHVGARLGPGRGRTDRGNPARRCRLVSSRLKALARGNADDRDDAHRHHGISQRQERRLARKGQRRTIPALDATVTRGNLRPPSCAQIEEKGKST